MNFNLTHKILKRYYLESFNEKGMKKNACNKFEPFGYFNGSDMDNDFRYAAYIINGYDNRTFHRNFTDSYINTGTDFNIYPENFSRVFVHSLIIALDRSKNAGNDKGNFRTT